MWQLLSLMQKKLTWSIPIIMILGIFYGSLFSTSYLKIFIIPLTFLMVYPMMINLDLKNIFIKGDTLVQIVAQFINFGIIPFVAFFIGRLLLKDPYLELGLLLAALLPTSGMTISWTGFANGNLKAAIKMTIVGLIIGSIATPFYIKVLLGTVIEIPLLQVFKQIVLIIFIPIIAGTLTRKIILWKIGSEKYFKIKSKFSILSTIGVLGIVFVAMSLKSKAIIGDPSSILKIMPPLIILYFLNFLLSSVIARFFFKYADGVALVYGTVMRNLSIALAIAMTAFGDKGSGIAIIISLAYIIQVQAGAWYLKLSKQILQQNEPLIATLESK